jgi:hypothetical protein
MAALVGLASAAVKWTAGSTRDIIPSDQSLLKLIT